MLQTPDLMLDIIREVVDRVSDRVPVTVKTRLGWDHEHRIIVDLAERIQDCGAEALTIHGRTRLSNVHRRSGLGTDRRGEAESAYAHPHYRKRRHRFGRNSAKGIRKWEWMP